MTTLPIIIEGRRVYVRDGSRTQTVNVCAERNERGEYEAVFRLSANRRVTREQVQARNGIAELAGWLVAIGAVAEGGRSRHDSAAGRPRDLRSEGANTVASQRPEHTQPRVADPLAGRRVLVLGKSPIDVAIAKERVAALGATIANNLTKNVSDVVRLYGGEEDVRMFHASRRGIPVMSVQDLASLEALNAKIPYSHIRP